MVAQVTQNAIVPVAAASAPGRLPALPPLLKRLHFLSDPALKNGIHIVAGPGSGKSRLLGRVITWQALLRGLPVVVLDPTGGVVLNLVDKIGRLPLPLRQRLWSKLVYVDAGATDFVVPTPLYYRLGETDTLFAMANRFPAVLKRQDPHLQSAPILGWNSLYECAIAAGQIAAALDRQLDFVADLIAHPRQYKEELRQVLARHPELEPAVGYFRELMDPTSTGLRERRTGSFANKLLPFLADPTLLAGFAAPTRGVDWDKVMAQGQTVLIDFQHEREPERRQFKLLWWFRDFIEYIKLRGMGGRDREVVFCIDEVTQLLGQRTQEGHSILAEDLEELVAVLARNYGVNAVIAHQNLSQVDERIRNVLLQMGSQLIVHIANPDDALWLARQFFRYDPYRVKKREPMWMNVPQFSEYGSMLQYSWPEVIDYKDVYFTPEEQLLQATQLFRLPRFQFWLRPTLAEGTVADKLYRVSIEKFDQGQYPDAGQIAQVLAFLRQKDGVPLETLLADLRGRSQDEPEQRQKPVTQQAAPAILNDIPPQPYATPSHPADTTATEELVQVSTQHEGAEPARTTAAASADDDDEFWR